jgi:hypothetical protein
MSCFAVAVGILAMVVRRTRVFLRLLMVAVIVVMGCLQVVMGRRFVLRSCIVMVFGGRVLHFLGHENILLQTTIVPDVSGNHQQKKPTWRNTIRYSATSAYSSNRPPGMAELPFC